MPYERDSSRFATAITSAHAEHLQTHGFAVVDEFLGLGWASAILTEMQWLQSRGLMLPNQIRVLDPEGCPFNVTKPNIYEVDLHLEEIRQKVPEINELFWETHTLAKHLNSLLPRLQLIETPAKHTLKLQCNTGKGACFPVHYDNPGAPDKRRVSALLYLNPDWEPSDGGQLWVCPFLGKSATIEPRMDRLVLFFSETMLHRVMPCYAERYCCTFWLDSDVANKDDQALVLCKTPHMLSLDSETQRILDKPSIQRHLSRAVYEEEYEVSIKECFAGEQKGVDAMLATHHQYIASLNSQPLLVEALHLLRAAKKPTLTPSAGQNADSDNGIQVVSKSTIA